MSNVVVKLTVILVIATASVSCSLSRGRHGDGGSAVRAMIDGPAGLAVIDGAVYVAEMPRSRIRRIDLATGGITTVKTSRPLDGAAAVCVDRGDLLVIEYSKVSVIDPHTGVVGEVAGTGWPGATGDDGLASAATLWMPNSCATDAKGNIYVADAAAKRIRRVDARSGIISAFAGTGSNETSGDGGVAARAGFEFPNSVAVDAGGDVFIAQYGDDLASHRIRRVDHVTGVVTTVAGPDTTVWLSATEQRKGIQNPSYLAFDHGGGLLFVDPVGGRIFRLDLAGGSVRVVAGGGSSNADGPAADVRLANPSGLAVTPDGAVVVAEYIANRVRRIDMGTGQVTTIGGNGKPTRVQVIM